MYKITRIALNKNNSNNFRYTSYYLYKKLFEINYTDPTKFIKRNVAQNQNNTQTNNQSQHNLAFISAGLLSFFFKSDDETPEDKLIMNIKRSVLSMQRGEYKKAESMLHLALRMAQDLNHKDGITYIFDLMANLALECEQFSKAKKLFVSVMQRLMQDGYKEDDIKV